MATVWIALFIEIQCHSAQSPVSKCLTSRSSPPYTPKNRTMQPLWLPENLEGQEGQPLTCTNSCSFCRAKSREWWGSSQFTSLIITHSWKLELRRPQAFNPKEASLCLENIILWGCQQLWLCQQWRTGWDIREQLLFPWYASQDGLDFAALTSSPTISGA